ncbi:hypothetical protein ACFC6L_07200 [Kitasatospora phosalacinea]|uniref:hypothetical protein n=1 Tax=Kitasatospora phosalacinea TaxID=2065 RepID=UPI0035DE4ED4
MGNGEFGQGWDGPWYRVRRPGFTAAFLPDAREPLAELCNVDVEVRLAADGSRWSATVFTHAEVGRLMARWARTGEELGGRYFWCSDALIVRDAGLDSIVAVLEGLYASGELTTVLQRLDEDDEDEDA